MAAEAVRRRDEVRSGRVQPIPGEQVLAELNAAGRIDWSRAAMDGSHIDAKKGVPGQVRRRSTAASPAASTT